MAYDAATVANRFIELAEKDGRKLTPMQLVKLTYIAHGFSLGLFKRPLIAESIQAWKYGPVVPSLYRRLKKYGRDPVAEPIKSSMFRSHETLSADDCDLVDQVYQKYGRFSGPQLSHLTHRPGTPWAETYEPGIYGNDMDDALIRIHYATLLAAR